MAKRKKKNVWKIIPSRNPEDQLYNRRLMSYFALVYSAVWFQEVLIVIGIGLYLKSPIDAAVVGALLGVPTTLAGLGVWKYLKACEEDDGKTKEKKDSEEEMRDRAGPSDT